MENLCYIWSLCTQTGTGRASRKFKCRISWHLTLTSEKTLRRTIQHHLKFFQMEPETNKTQQIDLHIYENSYYFIFVKLKICSQSKQKVHKGTDKCQGPLLYENKFSYAMVLCCTTPLNWNWTWVIQRFKMMLEWLGYSPFICIKTIRKWHDSFSVCRKEFDQLLDNLHTKFKSNNFIILGVFNIPKLRTNRTVTYPSYWQMHKNWHGFSTHFWKTSIYINIANHK